MSKAAELRALSEKCADIAREAADEPKKRRYKRLADGWKDVSRAQAWLDGEIPPVAVETTEDARTKESR